MIDFVSIHVKDANPELLFNNPNLVFGSLMNHQTGELIPNRYGNYVSISETRGLKIEITESKNKPLPEVKIMGSLHKFSQGNNYKDFSFTDLERTIQCLREFLQIEPESLCIHQIEFGVNIEPVFQTQFVINQMLSHAGKEYELRDYQNTGYLKRFRRAQFEIKIYDKGNQNKLTERILRVEIKVSRMAYLHNKGIGIKTIADLLNPALYPKLKSLLIEDLNKLIFTDDRINLRQVYKPKDRNFLSEAANPRYWTQLRDKVNRMQFSRQFKRFDLLRRTYAPEDLKGDFIQQVNNKWDSLSKNVTILPLTENSKMLRSDIHLVSNNELLPRHCITCGRDISHQKTGSKYCSEKKFGRSVKSCRNKVSNLKVHEKRFYPGATLFDIDSFLPPALVRLKRNAHNES